MIRMSLIMIFSIYGCVEYKCYPKVDVGIKKAENFCKQLQADKNFCNKITIYEKNMCTFVDDKNLCIPKGENINIFLRIPFLDCHDQPEQKCNAISNCEWSFKDSSNMKFIYP